MAEPTDPEDQPGEDGQPALLSTRVAARAGAGPVQLLVPPGRGASRHLPRRQLRPRADGPVRHRQDRGRSSPPDQLVPIPGSRIAPVPALPEPSFHPHRSGGHPDRTEPVLHLEPVPAVCRSGLSPSTWGPAPCDSNGGPRRRPHCSPRSSSARSASASRPRPMCGSDSASGPSCGPCSALPLAWGYCWQAISEGRRYLPAITFASLTVMLHFETGYLALDPDPRVPIPHPVLPQAPDRARPDRRRWNGGRHGLGDHPAGPLGPVGRGQRDPGGTALENGYGARRVLGWHGVRPAAGRGSPAGPDPPGRASGWSTSMVRFRRDERVRVLLLLAGHEPAPLVRPDDVRAAGRRHPRQHRHLHEALHVRASSLPACTWPAWG